MCVVCVCIMKQRLLYMYTIAWTFDRKCSATLRQWCGNELAKSYTIYVSGTILCVQLCRIYIWNDHAITLINLYSYGTEIRNFTLYLYTITMGKSNNVQILWQKRPKQSLQWMTTKSSNKKLLILQKKKKGLS